MATSTSATNVEIGRSDLGKRLDEIGWALFLVMMGALWLIPSESLPEQTWIIGAGAIILGVSFARYFFGLSVSGFTLFLGAFAIAAGISGVLAVQLPLLAVVCIVIGVAILLRPLVRKT